MSFGLYVCSVLIVALYACTWHLIVGYFNSPRQEKPEPSVLPVNTDKALAKVMRAMIKVRNSKESLGEKAAKLEMLWTEAETICAEKEASGLVNLELARQRYRSGR